MLITTITSIKDGSYFYFKNNYPIHTKIKQGIQFDYEVGVKEFYSVILFVKNFILSFFKRYFIKNDNAPKKIEKNTRVIIFIHGLGGGSFCFVPFAKLLKTAGIENVYAIDYRRSSQDEIPANLLNDLIKKIAKNSFDSGAKQLDVALVGHSLGGAIGYKYIWGDFKNKNVKVSMLISLAGLLKYKANKFSWLTSFFEKELSSIYERFKKSPNKALLYTIRGDNDELIHKDSAHIQNDNNKEFTIENIAHGGIANSKITQDLVTKLIKKWQQK